MLVDERVDDEIAIIHTNDADLLPATIIAERERVRLLQRDGKSGVAGFIAGLPVFFGKLGSAETAQRGLRYQPIAWTLIAVAALAFWFPGRPTATAPEQIASTPLGAPVLAPPTTAPIGGDAPAPAPTTTAAPVVAPAPTFTPTTRPPAPAPSPTPTFAPRPTPTTSPPPTSPPTTAAPVPLSIRGHGWAGSTGSTGIGVTPVPDGTLPVANRLSAVDKVSFIRLSGTARTLTLGEDTAGSAESFGTAAVKLCVILDAGWQETPGQNLADAPAWSDTCVSGVENSDQWTFDISGLGDPQAQTGFALVPGDAAPAEFQVTFAP